MPTIFHESNFRPQARILELLGDQLIRDHRIALFELVKNSYDADSPNVTIIFNDIESEENGQILVIDSGEGMSLTTLMNVWLEPASDHKKQKRIKGERTPLFGRLPLGEKGVGRFAVQKLGREIKLVTRRQNEKELCLSFNWTIIEGYKYLSEVPVTIEEREPKLFSGDSHGTSIQISSLKSRWTRGDIRRLFRSVKAMVSPFRSKDQFLVNFEMQPDPGWLEGLFSPEDAEQFALYHFDFLIDDDGIQWDYRFTPFDAMQADYKDEITPRERKIPFDPSFEFFHKQPPGSDTSWAKRKDRKENVSLGNLGIGPVYGKITAFDLDPEIKSRYINDTSGLSGFLKEQGGMRVYRNGMRVYDYGEQGNDWLGLDVRRVQRPSLKLSNNLFLGEILIDTGNSAGLVEKTNREGFIENEAAEEFRYAILSALTVFEAERQKDKKILRDCFKLTKEERKSHFHGPEGAIEELRKKVIREKLSEKIGPYVDRVEKAYTEAREILMSAVGSGLGLSVVFHELERGVRGLNQAIHSGRPMEHLVEMSEHLIHLLQGAAYLIRSNKPESFKASELIEHAVFTLEARFGYHNIHFTNAFETLKDRDFAIRGSRRMLLASLTNLIDNAIYWVKSLRKEDTQPFIWVGPSHDLEGPSIVIADNGPGFMDTPADVIAPFFTRKTEGMGLGLYYVDMALRANKGRLAFPETGDVDIPRICTGAVVAMVFPEGR